MTRAYVSPHRVLKVRLESDPRTEHRFEVGRLVPCATCGHSTDSHIGGKRKCLESDCGCMAYDGQREYSAADLAHATAEMVALLVTNRVTVAEVETPHTYTDGPELARAVVLAIEDAGIALDAPWRKEVVPPGVSSVCPGEVTSPALTEAPALAIDSGEPTFARASEGAKGEASTSSAAPPAPRGPEARTSLGAPSPTVAVVNAAGQTLVENRVGPRVAGIDPGTARIAVVIGDGAWRRLDRDHPPRFIAGRVFEIGRIETVRGRNVRVFSDDDVRQACPAIVMFLRAHGVERAIVESSNGGSWGNAAEATRANHVGGAILGYLLASGIAASRTTESNWYARVVGGKRKARNRTDPKLLAALRGGYIGWPEQSNEDIRDAGGVLLGDRMPKREPKRKRPTATPKPVATRSQKRQAKRKAIGCTCRGRSSHALTCPARSQ